MNATSARSAYDVIVPPELTRAWASLSLRDHDRLDKRLRRAAKAACVKPAAWPKGAPGIHRGRHRAIIDELWVLYLLNDEAQTLNLIGFGRIDAGA